jgi:hypothetical protein
VSLLLGLAAVVTSAEGFMVPKEARAFLLVATVFFVLAALGGLAANLPLGYQEPDPAALRELADTETWEAAAALGARSAAVARIDVLEAARSANDSKALWITAALGAEVVAIVFVAVAVIVVLA